ncbi:unannotated protein [freshwater metagenome]|uniref:Unannotated protein n=1 Tax=freshwater metagenome TaxID=449393 RepID=A0A6J6T5B8_9ZZZZ
MRCRPVASSGVHANWMSPSGTPADFKWATSAAATARACGAGLRIAAEPAATAWTRPLAGIAYGKFQGPATTMILWGAHATPSASSRSCSRVRCAA